MKKILLIIEREYLSRVRRKSFILTTLAAPLGFGVLIAISIFISTFSSGTKTVAVIDESGIFKSGTLENEDNSTVRFIYPEQGFDNLTKELSVEKEKPRFDALLKIPAGFDIQQPNKNTIGFYSAEPPGLALKSKVNNAIRDAVRRKKLETNKFSVEQIAQLDEKVNIEYSSLFKDSKAGLTELSSIIGNFMGIIIYITLMVYGMMTMKGVMEEKNNRIIEVLVSSVRPFQLLMGKIIGIGLVGLTQFILWGMLIFATQVVVVNVIGMPSPDSMPASPMGRPGIDAGEMSAVFSTLSEINFLPIIAAFLFFFMGGFFLYGALFAAVGAAASGDDGDIQSLTFPITIPIVISFIVLIKAIEDPTGKLAFWGSICPLSSPIIMPALIPFSPPLWQVALSAVLLIGGFLCTTYLAAKVYRTGILMYGKKVTLKEMARWITRS
jgi:ABC-2 type transport system permease protein